MILSIKQRINLELLLAQQKGPVGLVRALFRILDTIQLTEDERKKVNLRPVPGGLIVWDENPSEENLDKEFILKQEDARTLKQVLSDWPSYGTTDVKWVGPILDHLDALVK